MIIGVQRRRLLAGGGPPIAGTLGETSAAIAEAAAGTFAPWSPNSIASLAAWFDAQDAATLFSDDAATTPVSADGVVARVADKKTGSTNYLKQTTNGKRPIYKSAGMNSLPSFRYTAGNATFLQTNAAVSFGNPAAEVWIVGQFSALGTASIFEVGPNLDTAGDASITLSGGVIGIYFLDGVSYNSCGKAVSTDTPYLFIATMDSTEPVNETQFSLNGVAGTVRDYTFNGSSNVRTALVNLGGRGSLGSYAPSGDLCEMLLFNDALSSGDRALLKAYIAAKWGLSIA
jgi:hypothetical protein